MAGPYIETDDDARGLPYDYRGPKGMELPPARPAAYGLVFLLTIVFGFLSWLLLSAFPPIFVAALVASFCAAIYVTRLVMPHVDYYRPLRYYVSLGRAEIDAPRPPEETPDAETVLDSSIFKEGPRR